MKKAQKEKIAALCHKHGLDELFCNLLIELWNAQMSGKVRIIASVESVSASGMSRKLKFAVIRKNGDFQNVTGLFCKIYGVKMTNDRCLRVNGCGMDMIFSVLIDIFYKISLKEDFKEYSDFCRYQMF